MPRLPLLVAVALVLGSASAAPTVVPAPASPSVPRSIPIGATGGLGGAVTRIGTFRPRRDPTIRAAQRAFGRPASRKLGRSGTCTVDWRRLGLRISFENFGGTSPGQTTCTSTVGKAQSFVARGGRFRTWRGLGVGDPTEDLVELHPEAEFIESRWWFRFAESPYGDGGEYPSLYATVSEGGVDALKGWIGAAGE